MGNLGITLPIVMTILGAAWLQNRRIDTIDRRIDDTNRRIDELRAEIMPVLREIQAAIRDLDRRVTVPEERLSPIARG